jgi:uracil permease
MLGAGMGTIVYILITRRKSPVFVGSSFAFIKSMLAAFAGGVSMALGWLGLIIGAAFAGLVYVVLGIAVKVAGVNWLNKLMPPVVIGPTVSIIGLSLAGSAISDLMKGDVVREITTFAIALTNGTPKIVEQAGTQMIGSPWIALLCGLITLFVTMLCSIYGNRTVRLIPFIIGILSGYAVAAVLTMIGSACGIDALKIIDFSVFPNYMLADGFSIQTFLRVPEMTFLKAFGALNELSWSYVLTILVAYVPVAFVAFAEHIADHKNLSSIIEKDLTKDPGLDKTLLGDGIGSMAGAFFGGCPNTTYGESIGCVAITKNASVITVTYAAFLSILVAFVSPLVAFLDSIPPCVMGGVCMTLYGFIAVSGLKMLQPVDLNDNRNLFVASVILISGVGGLSLTFATSKGDITITTVACALILGIVTNLIVRKGATPAGEEPKPQQLIK